MISVNINETELREICSKINIPFIFKFGTDNLSSYDIRREIDETLEEKLSLSNIIPKFRENIISDGSLKKYLNHEKLKSLVKPKKYFGLFSVFNTEIYKSKILENDDTSIGYGDDYECFIITTTQINCYRRQKAVVKFADYDKFSAYTLEDSVYVSYDYEIINQMDRELKSVLKKAIEKQLISTLEDKLKSILENTKNKKEKLKVLKTSLLSKLDKDNNGTIDIIEEKNEFNLLLKKHQKIIIEKGKEFSQNYTHQFIKVGNYIKDKRSNLQLIFDCIKKVKNQKELGDYVEILEGEIYSYNLLLINSLNLIVSLVEDDQITFYDIYEKFDKLNIYNSNWENEISQKLTTLNKGISELNSNIKGLMYEIREMGERIVNSIEDLSYITEESTKMLDNRLEEIDSSIKTNNLLTMIQTYQTYKINQNTKSLRG